MQTLTARIERAAETGGTIVFAAPDGHVEVPWSQLHAEARGAAASLQASGVGPGDHVAILGPTSRPLVTAIQATWLCGAAAVVLPLPMRMGSIEEFVLQTRRRIRRADTKVVLIDDQLAAFVTPEPGDPPLVDLTALAAGSADAYRRPADDPDALAILQFTSGSTSEPKGVTVPNRTMCANLDAIIERTRFDVGDDVLVSWLPLYHDMGLVGLLGLPMTTGGRLVLGAPQDFLASPLRWMEWLSDYGGTATAGPNFAWVLATRALRRAEHLDLSRLRVALNGAEPIDPAAVRAFIEAAEPHGLRPGAVFPAFGMAEVAIAGTFPDPMAGLRTDRVDQRVLEAERYAAPVDADHPGSRELAMLGRPMQGLEMRIVDPDDGRVLPERNVGELEIKGTSVTPGYYRDPEANAESFHDGWLRTGDLAYLVDGELVMCGRIKDVIICGGRNIFPQDVEAAAAEVDGIRAGNVIAFGVTDAKQRERIVVVAETKEEDVAALVRLVHDRVKDATGEPPHDVVVVPAGSLPKTSSGKLQRRKCRDQYLDRSLEPVGSSH